MTFNPSCLTRPRAMHAQLLAALAAVLTACGGGSDAPAAAAATAGASRYAGTWTSACVDLSSALGRPSSYRSNFTITATNASSYTAAGGNTEWTNNNCGGTGTPIAGESGSTTFTVSGTKTIGSDVVDKLTYAGGGGATLKSLSFVSPDGRSLRLGGTGTPDAEGYPTALDPTVYTKQ